MDAPKPSPAEGLKSGSRFLRGTIAEELTNESTSFSKPAVGLLKFHGIYQQDDRDLRKKLPERVYSSMVRVGIPGGRITADQYLALDQLAGEVGDSTLRITSRQGLQFHYVGKSNVRTLLDSIGKSGLSTWAACGDVVRNVTGCSAPLAGEGRGDLTSIIREVSRALKPKSAAYAEIWLNGEKAVSLESSEEDEPLYGATYLPRKFKIGFVFEGDNTIDVYSNDLGFVAHYKGGELEGFTVVAGGGMGQSNGVKASHPRMADPVCFIPPSDVLEVAKATVTIHRDFGNRSNRKLARLKYVFDEKGVDWFRGELFRRVGKTYAAPRDLTWTREDDYLGWHRQPDNNWFFGLRVVSGRIKGTVRQALRAIATELKPEFRFTVQQNVLLSGLDEPQKHRLEEILKNHMVPLPHQLPPVLRHSMSCPALPTCGQAITESERALPTLVDEIQTELNQVGLPQEVVHVRTTGCPNGCARPYTAEIGIVGESVELYTLYLGGSPRGDRLAKPYRRLIKLNAVGETLRPLFSKFATERQPQEAFGDWVARTQPE